MTDLRNAPDRSAPTTPLPFFEEGAAFSHLTERYDVLVIGAGQAGLSVGYYLARQGVRFLILDGHDRIGDPWRHRWNSLRLFTSARYDGLVGMPFPAPRESFPTKDEMADYLESYARRFALPIRTGIRVDRLWRDGDVFVASAGARRFEAAQVVVAMSSYQKPRVPEFARDLDEGIFQRHSLDYRSPAQLREGDALVVGAGNSGAEIAVELARSRTTWLSGRETGHVPFDIHGVAAHWLLAPFVFRFVFHRLLTLDTPLGRKARPKVLASGGPLVRLKPRDVAAAGVRRVPRMAGVRDGKPLLEDGRVLDVANVVWATGFQSGLSWVDLPVFEGGELQHERGVVSREPGLYFVGQKFLYAFSSTMIHGVERDARHVATTLQRAAESRRAVPRVARSGKPNRDPLASRA
jgi:putative flavoprotein involved in K+ transport